MDWVTLAMIGCVLVAAAVYKLWDPDGWKSLVMVYPHRGRFPDQRIRAPRAELDDNVLARGLWLGCSGKGVHLASLDGRHRALVPWREVAVTWGREPDLDDVPDDPALRFEVRLDFREAGGMLNLPMGTAVELARAAGDRWPGPKLADLAGAP